LRAGQLAGRPRDKGVISRGEEQGLWRDVWHQLRRNRLAMSGLVIFLGFVILALVGLSLTTGKSPLLDPSLVRLPEKLRPPLAKARADLLHPEELPPLGIYLMGTDELGRDVFSRMMQGAWVSLTVGFVAVGIAVGIGIVLGGIAGYYGAKPLRIGTILGLAGLFSGPFALASKRLDIFLLLEGAGILVLVFTRYLGRRKGFVARFFTLPCVSVDTLIMRAVDVMLCFPSFFLILTVVAILPPSIYNIMAVIGLTSWMGTARFVRAEFLSLREQDFVLAAKALGLSDARIIFRHLVPNAVAPVLVSATLGIAGAILTEAGLSFLGFGVPPPHATWGNILSDGKRFLFDAPWLTLIPGSAVLTVVLAFNLFGEGLREALNPRLRRSR
jgi:peptide/nickel transport system permease protein